MKANISGQFKVKVVSPTGVLRGETGFFDNLVTDSGKDAIGFMFNYTTAVVGTGTTPPTASDTGLEEQIATLEIGPQDATRGNIYVGNCPETTRITEVGIYAVKSGVQRFYSRAILPVSIQVYGGDIVFIQYRRQTNWSSAYVQSNPKDYWNDSYSNDVRTGFQNANRLSAGFDSSTVLTDLALYVGPGQLDLGEPDQLIPSGQTNIARIPQSSFTSMYARILDYVPGTYYYELFLYWSTDEMETLAAAAGVPNIGLARRTFQGLEVGQIRWFPPTKMTTVETVMVGNLIKYMTLRLRFTWGT